MRRKYLKSRSWNYIHNLNRLYNSKVKALRDESEVSDILPHYQHVANNILQRMYSLEGKFKYAPVHD